MNDQNDVGEVYDNKGIVVVVVCYEYEVLSL